MAEQVILEEEDSTLPIPEEEVIEEDISLDESPDTRYDELGVSEFEQLLMEDSQRLSSVPEFEQEETEDYEAPSGVVGYGLQALGGVLDMIENTGDLLGVDDLHKAVEEKVESLNIDSHKLVFNIKGFENYDPNRPTISFMSDSEWDKLHSEDKVSFMPTVEKSDDVGHQLTRSLSNVVAGLIPAARIIKGVKGVATGVGIGTATTTSSKAVKGLKKFGDITAVGTLGSVFSFKPYEPRMANSMIEFVENTPFEVSQPFFEWLQASDDNSEVEERFKIALESMLMDGILVGAYSTFFKVFKRERSLMKAEAGGATPQQLEEINKIGINTVNSGEVLDVVYPPSRTPIKEQARAEVQSLKNASKDSEEFVKLGDVDNTAGQTVLQASTLSETGVTNVVKSLAKAMATGDEVGASTAMSLVGRDPLININSIDDIGVKNVINAISNELDREAALLGRVTFDAKGNPLRVDQIGQKTYKQAEKEGLSYANYVRRASGLDKDAFKNLADSLAIPEKELFTLMKADRLMADQIGSRVLGWQMVLDDLTKQFYNSLQGKDFGDEFVQLMAAKHIDVITKLHQAFAELPRGLGRGLAYRNIKMKNKYLNKNGTMKPDIELSDVEILKRKEFLRKQIHGKGLNREVLESINAILGTPSARLRSRRLKEALKGKRRIGKAVQEVYRGMLLANIKSMTTNLLGNMMETMLIPTAKTIGHISTFNLKGAKEELGFVFNMLMSTRRAFSAGMDALIHERNLLDPLRTKAETPSGDVVRGFYMQMDKAVDAGYWHPQNWIPLVVNSFGKVSRLSLRILGAQDEFFKMLTYNGKAMSKITKAMPDNLSRADKKAFIRRNLDHFYDEAGEAVDRDLLEYSRRATFQEGLEKGFANNLHQLVDKHPMTLGLIFPFVRTPANLISRFIQRTPVANFALSKRTRDMWTSGDPSQRAEVIGNTIMGVGLYGTAVSYAMDGTITGAGPIDREKNQLWRAAGFKPFSWKVETPRGPVWIKYDRLEPSSMPFLYIATLHENLYRFREDPDSLEDAIGLFIACTAKTMVDRTWLRGVKALMDGVDSAIHNENPSDIPVSIAKNFIPAIPAQVHRLSGIAEEESGAYTFRQALTWQEKMMAKLPPMEGYDAVKYNWLTGKPMMLPTGSDFGLDMHFEEPDKYMQELLRFGQTIQPLSKRLSGIELSSDQYSRLSELTGTTRIEGRTLMESLQDLMDSPEYDYDEDRIYHADFPSPQTTAVKYLVNAYKEQARMNLLQEDDELFKEWQNVTMEKAEVGAGLLNQ